MSIQSAKKTDPQHSLRMFTYLHTWPWYVLCATPPFHAFASLDEAGA